MDYSIESFPVGPLGCNCSILFDPENGEALLIDPGGDAKIILSRLHKNNLKVRAIIHTHAHFDHILGSKEMHEKTQAELYLHEEDQYLVDHLNQQLERYLLPQVDALPVIHQHLNQDQKIQFGKFHLNVFHTPGHTPGSCCFYLDHTQKPLLLSGDTLFYHSIGRTDLWGGNFNQIIQSIKNKLLVLPDATKVIPGHGHATQIQIEKKENPYFQAKA